MKITAPIIMLIVLCSAALTAGAEPHEVQHQRACDQSHGSASFCSQPGPEAEVPEPASVALLGAGLVALRLAARRTRLTLNSRPEEIS